MKLQRLLAVAGLLALVVAPSRAEDAPPAGIAIGDPAPMADTKMLNVDGRELAIADLKGKKGTLVVFSCNACPWAKAWETRIVELGNTYSKRGIGTVIVNSNDPAVVADDGYEQMKGRAKKLAMKFPYVVDATSEVARAFGATRTPEAFLFAADGRLVYHGTIDDNAKQPESVQKRYLRDALEAVSAGKSVAVQETKSLGCSIKFRTSS